MVVPQTRVVQERLKGAIEELSFDRGFHSPENQRDLAAIVDNICLPMPGTKQAARQQRDATVNFREARQRHSGVESAIGALQAGNGLERCRDHTELGFEAYVALGVLGRNLHVLGKLLISREAKSSEAAHSKRQAARHSTRLASRSLKMTQLCADAAYINCNNTTNTTKSVAVRLPAPGFGTPSD